MALSSSESSTTDCLTCKYAVKYPVSWTSVKYPASWTLIQIHIYILFVVLVDAKFNFLTFQMH